MGVAFLAFLSLMHFLLLVCCERHVLSLKPPVVCIHWQMIHLHCTIQCYIYIVFVDESPPAPPPLPPLLSHHSPTPSHPPPPPPPPCVPPPRPSRHLDFTLGPTCPSLFLHLRFLSILFHVYILANPSSVSSSVVSSSLQSFFGSLFPFSFFHHFPFPPSLCVCE